MLLGSEAFLLMHALVHNNFCHDCKSSPVRAYIRYINTITSPSATNCFSINFQVNIVSLGRKFCIYLHFTPLFTLWREHELRKRQSKFL